MSKTAKKNKNFSNNPQMSEPYLNGYSNKNNKTVKPVNISANTLSSSTGMNLGSSITKLKL